MPSSRSNGNGMKTVRLKCPWTGKVVSLAIWEEERVDLGSISRAFGVDPSTVRLNGYFLSRGADLVSCSVTWRSLLGFFASRGLSTGEDDGGCNGPLVVDGKLSKVGTKRGHDPIDADSRVRVREAGLGCGGEDGIIPQARDTCLLANKRLKDNKSEEGDGLYKWSGIGSKRKQLLEDISLLKKLKINENNSNSAGDDRPGIASCKQITCSLMSGNMKRTIGDELLLAPPFKRIRYKI